MATRSVILIAGPTASGKSALALRLAETYGGTIVNADSMQVYRELRILTARPTPAEAARVPHRLYGHVPASEAYSAGRYSREAAQAIREVHDEGRLPIVVGGTGLYFKALTEGLSPIPPVPAEIRSRWRARAAAEGAAAMHALLASRDPDMARRLDPADSQRTVRALEVLEASGRSLADWQRTPGVPLLDPLDCIRLVVAPERQDLYARCDARFDAMVAAGALAEARALAVLGLSAELPAMRALGVPQLLAVAAGTLPLADAAEAAKAETRQYAKRQMTWLNRNMIAWKWINAKQMETMIDDIRNQIRL